jgi:hypothetical protein
MSESLASRYCALMLGCVSARRNVCSSSATVHGGRASESQGWHATATAVQDAGKSNEDSGGYYPKAATNTT